MSCGLTSFGIEVVVEWPEEGHLVFIGQCSRKVLLARSEIFLPQLGQDCLLLVIRPTKQSGHLKSSIWFTASAVRSRQMMWNQRSQTTQHIHWVISPRSCWQPLEEHFLVTPRPSWRSISGAAWGTGSGCYQKFDCWPLSSVEWLVLKMTCFYTY